MGASLRTFAPFEQRWATQFMPLTPAALPFSGFLPSSSPSWFFSDFFSGSLIRITEICYTFRFWIFLLNPHHKFNECYCFPFAYGSPGTCTGRKTEWHTELQ